MALNGSAFLALWNDVDPARDAEYNDWHTQEHVPERVGIPGFLSGRRYVAAERSVDRYFTLYEVDALCAFAGPGYADVVARPTAWTLAMRASFRNFQRHPCATVYSSGTGIGGSVATFRFAADDAAAALDAGAAKALLAPFFETQGITSIHLGRAVPDAAFPLKNAAADVAAAGPGFVLLVEGVMRAGLDRASPRIVAAIEGRAAPGHRVVAATFDLAYVIRRSELAHPTTQRQPARR